MHQEQDEVLVRSPRLMKMMTLEYAPLAADIYWTRAVQYYGGKRLGQDTNLESLWPLLDVATTLDPESVAGVPFWRDISERARSRVVPAARTLQCKLLERGMQANPDALAAQSGPGKCLLSGTERFRQSRSNVSGWQQEARAASWMKVMAARFLEKGDSREIASTVVGRSAGVQ